MTNRSIFYIKFPVFVIPAMLLLWSLLFVVGCPPAEDKAMLVREGKPNVLIAYNDELGTGVKEAADELVRAFSAMTGHSFPSARSLAKGSTLPSAEQGVVLLLGSGILAQEPISIGDIEALAQEGYTFGRKRIDGKLVFQIASPSSTGVQYGSYDLLGSMGVRYFHPADTYTPLNPSASFDIGNVRTAKPFFALRGFHHHTQHPIPMSVYLLEPDDKHLPKVREYLLWLVRNRQNLLQWHFLKTVDILKWMPYLAKIRELAQPYGIKLGLTISFADQQQNNYQMIKSLDMPAQEQEQAIRQSLDQFMAGDLALFVVQFGTSEFTKVSDSVALRWLNTAATHLKAKQIPVYAWIHTAGELKADDGKSYYYHLPEKADEAMGVYVHTTMYYDMKHPAPVYGNEDFTHQYKFLERVVGKRPVVYFPETAWWLGFDNNLPLALPITGYSRGFDILELLKPHQIEGHVTFTTGMEWGYWKYDHYLTRVTWDGKTTWADYIKDFSQLFGATAETVSSVLLGWTDLQVRHFYREKPEIYFYLSGELLQDEIGQQAGVIARRPKRAFMEILNLKPNDFEDWEKQDLAKLQEMEKEYLALFEKLPAKLGDSMPEMANKLYLELYTTLEIYIWRIQHTILLYDAVRLARKGREDGGVGAHTDANVREQAIVEAHELHERAKKITQQVIKKVALIQSTVYRYPPEILATERSSLTSYPFGYLWETATGFFWLRREQQLDQLLRRISGKIEETWPTPAPAIVFQVKANDIKITEPQHPLIGSAIGPFIPGFLFAVPHKDIPDGKIAVNWSLATDHNANAKPDAESVSQIDSGEIVSTQDGSEFTGKIALYQLHVIDQTGNNLGVLGLQDLQIKLKLQREDGKLLGLTKGQFSCTVILENLIAIATQIPGLERDGLLQLLGAVMNFDPKRPPLDFKLEIELQKFTDVTSP